MFWSLGCTIGDSISIKKRGEEIVVTINDAEVAAIPDKVEITYVEDVNWDDILKKKYDVNEVVKKVN